MPVTDASPPPAPVVRIVDDQIAVREAVADLLASVGLTTRSFASAAAFLDGDDMSLPGCIVLDVRMPDLSGFDLLAMLTTRERALPVVFVTGHGDIAMAVRAMKAGAVDFLAKPFDDQALIDAVNAANRLDLERRRKAAPATDARNKLALLTESERTVLELVVQGQRNKQIAALLSVSDVTIKVRRARIILKLGVTSTAELIRFHACANLLQIL